MTPQQRMFGAGALAALVLVGAVAWNQHQWRERTVVLQRVNADLLLKELQRELQLQSAQFLDATRELADSDSVQGRLLPADVSLAADALVITDAAQNIRLSAAQAHGEWVERPADPALNKLLQTAASAAQLQGNHAPVLLEVSENRWLIVRPIPTHGSPAAIGGWLAAMRAISPASLALLSSELGATVTGGVVAENSRRESDARSGDAFLFTLQPTTAASAGFVALRDTAGRAVWALHVNQPAVATGGYSMPVYAAAAACLLLLAGAGAWWLKRHARQQRAEDGRYKALIDQANDGIVIVDAVSHKVLYANPAFLNRLEYNAEEAAALTLLDIFADGENSPEALLARLTDAGAQMAMNIQQRCKSGGVIEAEVRCNALDAEGRRVLAYVTHDVSLRRKAEQQLIENQQRLDRIAHHDQLTGLPNRHYLSAFLPQAIAEARAAGHMLGVVFLDLDRFKHINDTRGHETGDKLLQEVAARLRACVRESDVIIRMGGDEFVVVFRSVKSFEEVTLGAGRIVETLHAPIVIDQQPLQTTGSVGVSLYPRDGADMNELLKHSDTAMYQAKDRGRNNVQMFSHIMNRKLKQRVAVEASLREALRLKQFDVHYQPFVNLSTRKIVGLEALMRWTHPVHGMVPADQFIPVAEESGLIVPMGNFVLHRTLQTMSAWRKAGATLVPVSINVAPAQLQRGELLANISALLKTHSLRPDLLQLEMTERVIFDSKAPAGESRQDTMARLRDLGIKIAIDDFGTGYSSLSYLKNWRVDALKIDRSFVRDLVTDSSDLAIVSAIIAIAKHLQIQVVAEGIEGYQQAEILRRLGCTVGQGFLFARPMAAAPMLQLLRDNAATVKEEDEDMLAALGARGH